jgi:hypothetical protein
MSKVSKVNKKKQNSTKSTFKPHRIIKAVKDKNYDEVANILNINPLAILAKDNNRFEDGLAQIA